MKRIYASLFFIIVIVAGLVGCSKAATVINEVNLQELNKNVRGFADNNKNSNGLHLYSRVGEQQYLIVTYSSVLQGEKAKFLNSVKAQVEDQTLTINLEELGTDDYHDKRLKNIRIFKLSDAEKYEKIRIFKNGTETVFDSVGT